VPDPRASLDRREVHELKPKGDPNAGKLSADNPSGGRALAELFVTRPQDPDDPDSLFESGTLVNGKKEGSWSVYWPKGPLWSTHTFRGGLLHGESVSYDRTTGLVTDKRFYREGKLDGVQRKWYPNGTLAWEAELKEGELNGTQRLWYPDGSKKEVETFVAGKRQGWCSYWLASGEPDPQRRTGMYVQDIFVESK